MADEMKLLPCPFCSREPQTRMCRDADLHESFLGARCEEHTSWITVEQWQRRPAAVRVEGSADWLSIESAPKDGTPIWVPGSDGPISVCYKWSQNAEREAWCVLIFGALLPLEPQPTQWTAHSADSSIVKAPRQADPDRTIAPTPSQDSGWVRVEERLPEGGNDVLTWHPVMGCQPCIRAAKTVRIWASDPQDTSMLDAFWTPLPAPPAARESGDE